MLNYFTIMFNYQAMNFFWEAFKNNLYNTFCFVIQKKIYLPTSKSVLQLFQVLLFEVLSTSCPWRNDFLLHKRKHKFMFMELINSFYVNILSGFCFSTLVLWTHILFLLQRTKHQVCYSDDCITAFPSCLMFL